MVLLGCVSQLKSKFGFFTPKTDFFIKMTHIEGGFFESYLKPGTLDPKKLKVASGNSNGIVNNPLRHFYSYNYNYN